jgi:hypothetical protein
MSSIGGGPGFSPDQIRQGNTLGMQGPNGAIDKSGMTFAQFGGGAGGVPGGAPGGAGAPGGGYSPPAGGLLAQQGAGNQGAASYGKNPFANPYMQNGGGGQGAANYGGGQGAANFGANPGASGWQMPTWASGFNPLQNQLKQSQGQGAANYGAGGGAGAGATPTPTAGQFGSDFSKMSDQQLAQLSSVPGIGTFAQSMLMQRNPNGAAMSNAYGDPRGASFDQATQAAGPGSLYAQYGPGSAMGQQMAAAARAAAPQPRQMTPEQWAAAMAKQAAYNNS